MTPTTKTTSRASAFALLAVVALVGVTFFGAMPAQAMTCRFGWFGHYVECEGTYCGAGIAPWPGGGYVRGCAAVDA